jgi:DNA helicase-2/ATP-dependent DNA helicase PcrA
MDLLSNLNPNQKAAVMHTDGPLLILAGAGSGKTRVITHRIAYLIHEKGVPPYHIFAVTFTNKAAEEMKKRVMTIVGPEGNSVFIKTFHSAAVYMLRRFGEAIGITKNFSIYDQGDQEGVIKDILISMRLDPKKIKPSMIASKISEIKDKADIIDGAPVEKYMPKNMAFNFAEMYREYHARLKTHNALDFNDLLIKTVDLLRSSEGVLHEFHRHWRYFMVDEYQDTNHPQYLIAKYLSSHTRNICVVGDDDQSIYSWRGADIRNILEFENYYSDSMVITLDENYRSRQPILDAASAVILNNIHRKEKNLKATKGEGEKVTWCQTNNEYGEAEFAVSTIISLKHREGFKNSDFAIFYRTNAQSRVFEDMLRRENIPYRVIGGLKFYDRKEVKDIIAYLRFIANPLDLISLMRIINTPSRGVGKSTVEKIRAFTQEQNLSEWTIIRDDLLPGKVPQGLTDFREFMAPAIASMDQVPHRIKLSTFVSDIITASGYRKSLEEEDTQESNARLENINEFLNSVYDYENYRPDGTLEQFLQDISLLTSEENPKNEEGETQVSSITLMTVHNAKGLEFPVVFLTGMEENTFPHKFSLDTEEGIEEERRLCYVGITRAMERAFLTNAEIRRSFGGIDYKHPSRFISEIPNHLLEYKTYYSQDINRNNSNYDMPPRRSTTTAVPSPLEKKTITADKPETPAGGSKFRMKETVVHPKYGIGRVVGIEGSDDNLKLIIIFGSGKKTFLEKYTPLEKFDQTGGSRR